MRRQCELLGITRSTVYYEPKQADEAAASLKEEIMSRIDYWHTTMPYLGTRKIAVKLKEEGYSVGRKLVRSYMQEMGMGNRLYELIDLDNDGKEILPAEAVAGVPEKWIPDAYNVKKISGC